MYEVIAFVLAIIGIAIGAVALALYLSTSNQCASFEQHVYNNNYNGQSRPWDVCMNQNGMPAIHLTLPSYDIQFPAWNESGVWVK